VKKFMVAMVGLALVATLAAGCEEGVSSGVDEGTVSGEETVNMQFLISDEKNDIGNFESLIIEIASIGLKPAGDPGEWITLEANEDPDDDGIPGFDLTPLEGENALILWSGSIDAGDYNKVFIHVDNITGILTEALGGGKAEVKLPSDRLQISKPFTVGEDQVVNFVYDITVHKAGNSYKYILKPQIAESGPNQQFNNVTPQGVAERYREQHKEQNKGQNKEQNKGNNGNGGAQQNQGQNGGQNQEQNAGQNQEQNQGQHGDMVGQIEWFEGEITAITEGEENASPWTMTLSGVDGPVTVYVIELEGTPAVGAWAEIEGILSDSTITDAKAEIEEE